MDKLYPTFDLKNLNSSNISKDLFHVDRFAGYVENNPHVGPLHGHTFYHFVYFTSGEGQQILDFEHFPIQPGILYFMRPGQVHRWNLKGEVDGYIVNFSSTFLDQLMISSKLLEEFTFFEAFSTEQVFNLDSQTQSEIIDLFEKILWETETNLPLKSLKIAGYLLEIFITTSRKGVSVNLNNDKKNNYNSLVIKNFLELIEKHYRNLHLPKDYANLLSITSNHLNVLCKEQLHTSAGVLIRNRVVLEAKRLLVNFSLSVADISFRLNFTDTSYFIKFFKKYTGLTPEAFRKQYYNMS